MGRRFIGRLLLILILLHATGSGQNSKENADFKLAINLYTDGLYDLAAEQLKQFIASYPAAAQGVDARFYLGLTQQKLKQFDEARMTFQTFALTYQDNPKAPEAWWNVAEACSALGNPREAALAFERVKVFHPKSKLAPEALVRSGDAFLAAGERDNARRVLRIVLQEYGSSPAVLNARSRLASIYFAEGNLAQAQSELKRVTEGDPSPDARAQALLLLGNIQQATGKGELARAKYQEIIRTYKNTSAVQGAYVHLARLLAAGGEYRDAAENFRKAAGEKAFPDSALTRDALLGLGDALAALHDYAPAITAYERYLPLATGDGATSLVLWKIARASALGKNFRRSNDAAQRLLKSTAPDSLKRRAQIRLGLNAEEQKNAAQAIQLFLSFTELAPDDLSTPEIVMRAAGLAERVLGDLRKAADLYGTVFNRYEHSPFVDDAVMGAARCHEALKEFDRSVPLYRLLLQRYPASEFEHAAEERLHLIEVFEAKDKDAGLEKLALLLGDVVAQKNRAGLAYRLGEIYFSDLKNYGAAVHQMEAALEIGLSPQEAAEARYLRARSLEYLSIRDASQRPKAIRAYQEYLASGADGDRGTDAALSLFSLRSTSLAEARSAARELIAQFPSFPHQEVLLTPLGGLLRKEDSTAQAMAAYAEAYRLAPSSPAGCEAGYRLFELLLAAGLKDSALSTGTRMLDDNPDNPFSARVAATLGSLARGLGKTDQAITYFRMLENRFYYTSDAASATRDLADASLAHGNYNEAIELYDQLLQRQRASLLHEQGPAPDLLLAMGKAQYLGGNFETAKGYLFQVLASERSGPNAGEAYTTLGMIARSAGALSDATMYFKQASGSAPGTSTTPEIADLLYENGDFEDAARSYALLLASARADSEKILYHSRVILSFLKSDEIARAEKEIPLFLKRHRDARNESASFDLERGNYYFRKEDYPRALQAYRIVLSRFDDTPAAPDALYWTGRTLEATNKPKEAIEQLTTLLANYPDAPIAGRTHLALGNLSFTLEQWDEAVRQYRTIVENPQSDPALLPLAMSNLIETYEIAGTNDAALALTRKYLERFPENDDQLDKKIKIGILYERLGYYDQAVMHLQSLLDEAGSDLEGEIRYYIAEANYNKGDYQQAILDFLKVPYLVTKKGKLDWTANSLYMSGQAYEKMGRYDQALTMYQQIVDRSGIDEVFKTAARKEIDRVRLVLKKKAN
jgi:TolA-binding protein